MEAQLAARLSAQSDDYHRRRPSSHYDSESSVSIDEDFDDASTTSSWRGESRRSNRYNRRARDDEDRRKPSYFSAGVQTDLSSTQIDQLANVENNPAARGLFDEIGSLQKELADREVELQKAKTREYQLQESVRALRTSLDQATAREQNIQDARTQEKDATQRHLASLQKQAEDLQAQLVARTIKAEDEHRKLQLNLESLRTVADAEKEHSRQKDIQIDRLTQLLKEKSGEEITKRGKESEQLVELQRLQMELQRTQAELQRAQGDAQRVLRDAEELRELKLEVREHEQQELALREEMSQVQNIISTPAYIIDFSFIMSTSGSIK